MIKNTSESKRKSSSRKRKSVQHIDNLILQLKTNFLSSKSKSKGKKSIEKTNSLRKHPKCQQTIYSHQITPQNRSIENYKENKLTCSVKKLEKSLPKQKVDKFYNKYASVNISPTSVKMKLLGSKNDYRFMHKIGSGGFGKVWKVQEKRSNRILAMKEISKAKVITKKSVNSILNQKQLLNLLHNNFLINAYKSFQDRENLYLLMEYLRGGDLRYHMCYTEEFKQNQIRFISACIIQGLQYIHSKKVIHRDLKPQNIVFEENGYLRITDFGVARKFKENNFQETSGTPGYMAPEVICRNNHSFEADFFALGVIIYQLIFGIVRPYMGDSRKQIREKMLTRQVIVEPKDIPEDWDPTVAHLITKLLIRNPQERLGFNGICEIKKHPWFRKIDWQKLSKKQMTPLFIPGIISESSQYLQEMEQQSEFGTQPYNRQEESLLLRTEQIQNLFKNYESDNSSKFTSLNKKKQLLKKSNQNSKKKKRSTGRQHSSSNIQKYFMTTNHSNSVSFAKLAPFLEKPQNQNKINKMSVKRKNLCS